MPYRQQQMNPIISAFMQSRQLAEETARGMKQQELLEKRLMVEQEANEAEALYKQSYLQNLVEKAKQDKIEFDAKNKIETQKNQLDALNTIRNMLDKNLLGQGGLEEIINSQGLSPNLAQGFKDYQTRTNEEAQRQADLKRALIDPTVEEIEQTAQPLANAAGLKAGAVAEAQYDTQEKLENLRADNRATAAEAARADRWNLEKYKQSQANARADARNKSTIMDSTVKSMATSHDSHPIAKRASEVTANYNAITQIPNQHNNPNFDLDLIVYAVKVSDPGVSARSVEVENVRKWSQGLPQVLRSSIERTFNSNGAVLLTPQARHNIKMAAENAAISQLKVYLPYRNSVAERMALHKGKSKDDPDVQTAVGVGFLPPNIIKVDKDYRWNSPLTGKSIPLYRER